MNQDVGVVTQECRFCLCPTKRSWKGNSRCRDILKIDRKWINGCNGARVDLPVTDEENALPEGCGFVIVANGRRGKCKTGVIRLAGTRQHLSTVNVNCCSGAGLQPLRHKGTAAFTVWAGGLLLQGRRWDAEILSSDSVPEICALPASPWLVRQSL